MQTAFLPNQTKAEETQESQPLMDAHSTGPVQSKPPRHIQHRHQVVYTNCFALPMWSS